MQHQQLSGLGVQTPASVHVPRQLQERRTPESAQILDYNNQQAKHGSSASPGGDSTLGASFERQRGQVKPDSPTSASVPFSLGPRYSSQSGLHAGAGAAGGQTVALPRPEQQPKGMARQVTAPLAGSSASSADLQLQQHCQPTASSGASSAFREIPRES